MATFHLDILTPYGHFYSGEVDYLSLRNDKSVLGILPKHASIISKVNLGKIEITISGHKHVYATTGGLLNIDKSGNAKLMLSSIEKSDEIDIDRAKRAKQRAIEHINSNGHDIKRAKEALARAENRIKVANNE